MCCNLVSAVAINTLFNDTNIVAGKFCIAGIHAEQGASSARSIAQPDEHDYLRHWTQAAS